MSKQTERMSEGEIERLPEILIAKYKGERNTMGDAWSDVWINDAAKAIIQLRTDLAAMTKRFEECLASHQDLEAERDALREQLKVAREALERISNEVMWGIQYRYIARDGLGDRSPIQDAQEFDKNGDLITDYREQDADSLVDKETAETVLTTPSDEVTHGTKTSTG